MFILYTVGAMISAAILVINLSAGHTGYAALSAALLISCVLLALNELVFKLKKS